MISQLSFLLAAAASTVSAQYALNNTLGSCADVDCPSAEGNNREAACQVTNRTYSSIGLESFSTGISQDNLTWTIATNIYERPDPNNDQSRNVEKDFYLGTPFSLDLTSDDLPYQGCAIFLYGNVLVKPQRRNESHECGDVIGTECMASLLKDATAILVGGQNGTETAADACDRVQRGLNEPFSSGCEKVTGRESWVRTSAVGMS